MGTMIFIGGAESAPPPPVEVLQYPRLFRVKLTKNTFRVNISTKIKELSLIIFFFKYQCSINQSINIDEER